MHNVSQAGKCDTFFKITPTHLLDTQASQSHPISYVGTY